uniref:Uncharacterized protein n=1 Tax=Emiliania huxleyi TaxID=2903 RepID=A0A6V2SSJ3_EMIHU
MDADALAERAAATASVAAAKLSSAVGRVDQTVKEVLAEQGAPSLDDVAAAARQQLESAGISVDSFPNAAVAAVMAPGGGESVRAALDAVASSEELEALRREGNRVLGHVLASESAISVLGYVEEQSVTAAAESAAVIDGAVSRLRGAVDSGIVGSAVSAGASFVATSGVEPDALRRVLALATGSLQPSPPAVQVQLRVVGGSVKCDVCAGSSQGGGDGGQPGNGGLGDGGRLGGAVQWVQEQKLGQQALAHGVAALQRLDSGAVQAICSDGERALVDPEARAELLSRARDALLSYLSSYLPTVEVPPVSRCAEGESLARELLLP